MKNEISKIEKSLSIILKSDTNNLITVSSNDKDLKKLATSLNKNLKNLRKLELEYKQGNQELKASITNISHDLRTPLTAIRGYLDLIEKEKLENKQLEYLKIIDSKVKDLTELTQQLFDLLKGIYIMKQKEKIFDRYYTVINAQKSNGIGLSIAKQLVELSGGKIKAKYENNYLIIEIRF